MAASPAETLVSDAQEGRPTEDQRGYLVLALQCDRPETGSARYSLAEVDEVVIGRGATRSTMRHETAGRERRLEIRVPDRWLSQAHVRLRREGGRFLVEDTGSQNGMTLNGVRQRRAALRDGDLIEIGATFFLFRELASGEPNVPDIEETELDVAPTGLLTFVPALAARFEALNRIARSAIPVVIQGESGTGKELVARSVHRLSCRRGAFVAINCGAIPETLVTTELFGYRKGAFSGATDNRIGVMRSAHQGTLFLDEIGDLSLSSQAAVLRVFQENEVTPVGATRPVRVDLRLVAATHRNLERRVTDGTFRNDLYARVSGFNMQLPPLRERREDLGLLVTTLLSKGTIGTAGRTTFSVEAVRALFRYDWPLNIRELEKCLATAAVLAGGERIELEHLPDQVRFSKECEPAPPRQRPPSSAPLGEADERRRAELIALLREQRGNVSAVARALGKARMQIHRWMRRYQIELKDFRSEE